MATSNTDFKVKKGLDVSGNLAIEGEGLTITSNVTANNFKNKSRVTIDGDVTANLLHIQSTRPWPGEIPGSPSTGSGYAFERQVFTPTGFGDKAGQLLISTDISFPGAQINSTGGTGPNTSTSFTTDPSGTNNADVQLYHSGIKVGNEFVYTARLDYGGQSQYKDLANGWYSSLGQFNYANSSDDGPNSQLTFTSPISITTATPAKYGRGANGSHTTAVNVTNVNAVGVGGNVASDIISHSDNAYSNAVTLTTDLGSNAYSNAVTYTNTKAATATSNAESHLANVDILTTGTFYSGALDGVYPGLTVNAATQMTGTLPAPSISGSYPGISGVNANGLFTNVEVFTANGTFTAPPTTSRVRVTVIGAGGGGGGGAMVCMPGAGVSATTSPGDPFYTVLRYGPWPWHTIHGTGSGGGGGAFAQKDIIISPTSQHTITVGIGGNGAAPFTLGVQGVTDSPESDTGKYGAQGGNSSFGDFVTAQGGYGGWTSGGSSPTVTGGGANNTFTPDGLYGSMGRFNKRPGQTETGGSITLNGNGNSAGGSNTGSNGDISIAGQSGEIGGAWIKVDHDDIDTAPAARYANVLISRAVRKGGFTSQLKTARGGTSGGMFGGNGTDPTGTYRGYGAGGSGGLSYTYNPAPWPNVAAPTPNGSYTYISGFTGAGVIGTFGYHLTGPYVSDSNRTDPTYPANTYAKMDFTHRLGAQFDPHSGRNNLQPGYGANGAPGVVIVEY
jgi:hypothetical protein